MKILLIKPYTDFPTRIPHLGLGYLAAAVRRTGREVRILDCPRENIDEAGLLAAVDEWRPDVVGLSAFSPDLPVLRRICRRLREGHPGLRLVVGGPHPSCLPEHCFEYLPELDFAFVGEAELGLVGLLDRLDAGGGDWAAVPGLAWRRDGGVVVNPARFEPDLDTLGMPAWDLLRPGLSSTAPHGAFVRRLPVAPIITTRGCPFPCTFCAARNVSGRLLRSRSLEAIFEEIDHLVVRHGVRELHIEDDNFTFHKEFALGFCDGLLRRGLDLTWCCPNGVRLDTLDRELLELMKRSGCYSVSVGIESGSDRVLRDIRKRLDTEEIRRRLELVRAAGIKTTGFFIIGFPGESEAEIRQTMRFARTLPLDRAQFSTFLPLPGTPYFDDYRREHPLATIPWEQFFTTEVVEPPAGLTRRRMLSLQRNAFLRFYLRPRILWGLLREVRDLHHLAHLARRVLEIFK